MEAKTEQNEDKSMQTIEACYTICGVSAITGRHPDTGTPAHWIEVDGHPVRMPRGGVDTYPSRRAAIFAAKRKAYRLGRWGGGSGRSPSAGD